MAEAKTETAVKTRKVSATSKPAEAVKAATAKAPVAKAEKAAAPKAKAAAPAKKPSAAKAKKNVTPEQRYNMICEAAYFKAERRGFSPDNVIQDWLEAEAEINKMLNW
ncbi:MAG: DUF2934 domain-containing protein [Sulfurimicrobium sp.]